MMLSTSNLTAFTATKNALTPGVSILFLIQKIKRLLASKTLENIMSKIFECVLQGEVVSYSFQKQALLYHCYSKKE